MVSNPEDPARRPGNKVWGWIPATVCSDHMMLVSCHPFSTQANDHHCNGKNDPFTHFHFPKFVGREWWIDGDENRRWFVVIKKENVFCRVRNEFPGSFLTLPNSQDAEQGLVVVTLLSHSLQPIVNCSVCVFCIWNNLPFYILIYPSFYLFTTLEWKASLVIK